MAVGGTSTGILFSDWLDITGWQGTMDRSDHVQKAATRTKTYTSEVKCMYEVEVEVFPSALIYTQ